MKPDRYEDGRPMLMAGIRRRHDFSTIASTIPKQWEEFELLEPIPGRCGSDRYGLMCQANPEWCEYMTGVEVADLSAVPPGLGRMRVPGARYAVFVHSGPAATISDTWRAIWEIWLPDSGETPADTPDFEHYGQHFDPASGTGGIEIWFPVVSPGE